jgi:hypothetical protein
MSFVRIKHLNRVRDIQRVLETRRDHLHHAALVLRFQELFEGRRVIVTGSSRDFVPPEQQPGDVHVCVNASAHNADRLGVAESDATFAVGYLMRQPSQHARESAGVLRGRRTRNLFLITSSVPFEAAVEGAMAIGLGWDTVDYISIWERAAILGSACGQELGFGNLQQQASSGAVAVAGVMLGLAREIVLCGFSFHSGHSYTSRTYRRLHRPGDQTFFRLLAQDGRISTTSADLHAVCGIRLATATSDRAHPVTASSLRPKK